MPGIPIRRNGFSRPFSKAQVSAWIALVACYVEFILIVSPILPIAASVPVTIFFSALVAGAVFYGFKTILVDPIDVHLSRHLGTSDDPDKIPEEEEMKQCWICDVQVAQHSMHCKFCNKCVYHFDHHCMCKSLPVIVRSWLLSTMYLFSNDLPCARCIYCLLA
jgi:hypothetical protein